MNKEEAKELLRMDLYKILVDLDDEFRLGIDAKKELSHSLTGIILAELKKKGIS